MKFHKNKYGFTTFKRGVKAQNLYQICIVKAKQKGVTSS